MSKVQNETENITVCDTVNMQISNVRLNAINVSKIMWESNGQLTAIQHQL